MPINYIEFLPSNISGERFNFLCSHIILCMLCYACVVIVGFYTTSSSAQQLVQTLFMVNGPQRPYSARDWTQILANKACSLAHYLIILGALLYFHSLLFSAISSMVENRDILQMVVLCKNKCNFISWGICLCWQNVCLTLIKSISDRMNLISTIYNSIQISSKKRFQHIPEMKRK